MTIQTTLTKMVTAKASLLKMAHDTGELPIRQVDEDGGKLRFPWSDPDSTSLPINAYVMLIDRLCTVAKEKKRVTAKDKATKVSPKYAMRYLLLSLGFIGDEYKSAKKTLLAKMTGSSSRKEVTDDDISK